MKGAAEMPLSLCQHIRLMKMVAEDRYSPYHTFTQNCMLNEIPTKSKYWITTGGKQPKIKTRRAAVTTSRE